jgi:hypothetical protein
MRLNCTTRTYNIPKVAIKRIIDRTIVKAVCCEQLLGCNADPEGVWNDWVIHVVQRAQTLIGLTRRGCRYKVAERKISCTDWATNRKYWRQRVSRTYCWSPWNITHLLKKPPRTEIEICAKKENISLAWENIAYGQNNVSATRIFNMDKFAVSTAQKPENYWLIRVKKGPFQNVNRFGSTNSAKWRKYVASFSAWTAWKEPHHVQIRGRRWKSTIVKNEFRWYVHFVHCKVQFCYGLVEE